jgi:phosphoribosylamine--glycine ligase/phosphoribosylformylglycinamidine cyclo-ligase
MMTSNGPKLIEYNVRFGDPEAQTLLPLLDKESDLAEIMLACLKQNLRDIYIGFMPEYAVSVVVASRGYPERYETGKEISIIPCEGTYFARAPLSLLVPSDSYSSSGVMFFHAGTTFDGRVLRTDGGRVIAAVYLDRNLNKAIEGAYKGLHNVKFDGMYFRKDIGKATPR